MDSPGAKKTRWWRSPTWLSLPPAVSIPWDWHCLGQLPTSMSVPLLLFGQPDPVGLGTAVPSCCCFWGKKTDSLGTNIHSPGPNSSSSAQQLCIAKFPLKQFWIEKKAVSWRTMPGNFLGISTRNKKEDSVCLFPSLKGIPQTSQPGQNLPLQGKRL